MRNRRHIGYGVYGDVFEPNFKVCKSEGGTSNCPSEYVREFSGIDFKEMRLPILAVVFGVLAVEMMSQQSMLSLMSLGKFKVKV